MHILLPRDMSVTFRLVDNHLPRSPLTVAQNRHALAQRPGAAPGEALSGADPASAVGSEAQATKAAVILPKPRVAPVQQPAVKHEEAVPAHTKKNSKARGSSACAEANSEEGQPDTSSAQERLRGQPLQGGPRPRTHCRGAGAEWRCILLWLR